jgi:hypothetical protein
MFLLSTAPSSSSSENAIIYLKKKIKHSENWSWAVMDGTNEKENVHHLSL